MMTPATKEMVICPKKDCGNHACQHNKIPHERHGGCDDYCRRHGLACRTVGSKVVLMRPEKRESDMVIWKVNFWMLSVLVAMGPACLTLLLAEIMTRYERATLCILWFIYMLVFRVMIEKEFNGRGMGK